MTQQVLVYILLSIATLYVLYKFVFKRAKKQPGEKDCDNCS